MTAWRLYYNLYSTKEELDVLSVSVDELLAAGPDVSDFHSSNLGKV
jgi:hypothetical protein